MWISCMKYFSYSSAHLTYPPLPSVPQFPFRLPCVLKRAKHSFSEATAPEMQKNLQNLQWMNIKNNCIRSGMQLIYFLSLEPIFPINKLSSIWVSKVAIQLMANNERRHYSQYATILYCYSSGNDSHIFTPELFNICAAAHCCVMGEY